MRTFLGLLAWGTMVLAPGSGPVWSNPQAQPEPASHETASVNCPKCQAPCSPQHKFCGKCGAKIAPASAPAGQAFQERFPEVSKSVVKVLATRYDKKEPTKVSAAWEGTGMAFQRKGWVLTHFWVVDEADKIEIRLTGSSKALPVKTVRTDKRAGIALLEADMDVPLVKTGDSTPLRVGDTVYCLGYEYNLLTTKPTMVKGSVSALDRSAGLYQFEGYFSTDFPFRPGFAGAPVFNEGGEAVGMRMAIAGEQVSMAAPMPRLEPFALPQILDSKARELSWLGAEAAALDEDWRKKFKAAAEGEALVVLYTYPGSPAPGVLRRGDVLESINGKKVRYLHEAQEARSLQARPGPRWRWGSGAGGRKAGRPSKSRSPRPRGPKRRSCMCLTASSTTWESACGRKRQNRD
jgi:S1-C subfamily serine protease